MEVKGMGKITGYNESYAWIDDTAASLMNRTATTTFSSLEPSKSLLIPNFAVMLVERWKGMLSQWQHQLEKLSQQSPQQLKWQPLSCHQSLSKKFKKFGTKLMISTQSVHWVLLHLFCFGALQE